MKIIISSLIKLALTVLVICLSISCSENNTISGDDNTSEYAVLEGNLTTQTLTKGIRYLLMGQVFVREGQVLTIEPGTVIFGDKRTRATLIIDKGGQLIADGTRDEPIVFTSVQEPGVRDRGDWGRLLILGRANVNQPSPAIEEITPKVFFGTTGSTQYDDESSGILRYVPSHINCSRRNVQRDGFIQASFC